MSFDTQYPNRKDRRKPFRKSKRFDRSCRNHGDCPYCMDGRLYFDRKARLYADMEIEAWWRGELAAAPLGGQDGPLGCTPPTPPHIHDSDGALLELDAEKEARDWERFWMRH
jgi:hypothetical protein